MTMNDGSSAKPFSLAIIGGGIAGCILSISLTKRNIEHTLYESAAQFGEIGAGVGFAPNFVRLMSSISPELEAAFFRVANVTNFDDRVVTGDEAEKAGEKLPPWLICSVGDLRRADKRGYMRTGGSAQGNGNEEEHKRRDGREVKREEYVFHWDGRPGPWGGVHRAHLLDELVKLIPSHVPRFNKRLIDVKEADDGSEDAILHFVDGSTARHAAVIGCDGIKSRTRELILGKKEAAPVFTGKYAYRGLVPMSKAVDLLGEKMAFQNNLIMGYHGHLVTFAIANGTIFNVVAFTSKESWTDPEWVVQASREEMTRDWAEWSPEVRGIFDAMQRTDIWAIFNHEPARTYYQSRPKICLVGDAAHASSPHHGAGAGFCVEDVYILGGLLGDVDRAQDLTSVFQAYDEVRRARSQQLVEKSREAGMMYDFEGTMGDDLDAIERDMLQRIKWLWDADVPNDLERARSLFRSDPGR